jgi:cbb3-type cytochrome oxidase maturation protein
LKRESIAGSRARGRFPIAETTAQLTNSKFMTLGEGGTALALALGLAGLAAFLWSLRTGQYNDLDGAALRILSDDDIREPP